MNARFWKTKLKKKKKANMSQKIIQKKQNGTFSQQGDRRTIQFNIACGKFKSENFQLS